MHGNMKLLLVPVFFFLPRLQLYELFMLPASEKCLSEVTQNFLAQYFLPMGLPQKKNNYYQWTDDSSSC